MTETTNPDVQGVFVDQFYFLKNSFNSLDLLECFGNFFLRSKDNLFLIILILGLG